MPLIHKGKPGVILRAKKLLSKLRDTVRKLSHIDLLVIIRDPSTRDRALRCLA